MKFGLCPYQFGHDFELAIEEAVEAENLGFDSIWFLEHHGPTEAYYPSPLIALAALATRTKKAKLGTCVLLLPLYNPVHVAEDGAMIDLISKGRLILGLGMGYRAEEFGAFGVSLKHRRSRMEEGVEIIRRLWTEEEVTFCGKRFSFEGVAISPKPVQKPSPPIWMGGWSEIAVRRAARMGDAWLAGQTGSFDYIKKCRRVYCSAMEELGDETAGRDFAVAREVFVGQDRKAAKREARRYLEHMYREDYWRWGHLAKEHTGWPVDEKGQMVYEKLERDNFVVGDPAECAEIIERYAQEAGASYMVCRMHFPLMSREEAMRSIRLFAEKVMPSFG